MIVNNYNISLSELDNFLKNQIANFPVYLPDITLALQVLYITGCRPIEVCEPFRWQQVANNQLQLTPVKFSNNRCFGIELFNQQWLQLLQNNDVYITQINYRKLQYHWYKKIGKFGISTGNKKSLLHLFRHNYIKKNLENVQTLEQLQYLVGHKDSNSTVGYLTSTINSYTPLI